MKSITATKIVKKVSFLAFALISTFSWGQEDTEEPKKFTLSGSVDAYYRSNINSTNKLIDDGSGGEVFVAPPTSFANDNGFALGMINLIAGYEGEKVGFVADLVFGPRGEDAVFLSVGSTNIVNQLYVYWNVSEKVTLTFGNFNTYLGYEVISPTGNFNYSTSYMFSNGPFSHAGLKADFKLSDKWSAMLAIMNSTDYTEFNPGDLYTYGAQLGYSVDATSAYLNFLYGKQGADATDNTFQVDLTAGSDLSEEFFLGLNATYNDTDGSGFYGVALYPQYKTSPSFALGLRGEYFGVFQDGADDDTVFAATLTGSYAVGDLTIKPELRIDSFEEEVIPNADLDDLQKSLASFTLAAIYSF